MQGWSVSCKGGEGCVMQGCDTICSQLILSSRLKSVFLHITLKVGYNLRKFGMTLSGRNYIMCRSILEAASREKA